MFGSGGGCYRLYGDSYLEMTGGQIENVITAGSDSDRRMIGNGYTKILAGEFIGLLAGSYGVRSNHMIDGNIETIRCRRRLSEKRQRNTNYGRDS